MASIEVLEFGAHRELKLSRDSGVIYARNAHMLTLRVTEVAQATVDFPVLISRMTNGALSLSALTSFEPSKNLFVSDGKWCSSFTPSAMSTYPIFLMQSEKKGPEPILGIDRDSPALGKGEGELLFDKRGKVSLPIKQLKTRLIKDSKDMIQTFHFFEKLTELDLIVSVDMMLTYSNDQTNRIRGLSMIHEDNLRNLDAQRFSQLRDLGYLAPIYAMLLSVFQLNALIRRNNRTAGSDHIKSINLEVSKDRSLA